MSDPDSNSTWTLAELAELAGLSRRTIRFYIARGVVPGPRKAGRHASYGPDHLGRLQRIRELQAAGLTLTEIAHRLAGGASEAALPAPVTWQTYRVAPDVTIQVRADASPWRMKQIREALREVAARLAARQGGGDAENS